MDAKRWLQFAVCVLLLLNAGCDADYPLQAFINTDKAEPARLEKNAVEDLELWTMPLETDESGEVVTERNRNRLVKQPTLEELRKSLDRVNKVISRIDKVLANRQEEET